VSQSIHDVEQILSDCFRSFASFPGGALVERDGAFGVRTRVPISFFSGIASTSLTTDDEVDEVSAIFREAKTPFRWWLTPSTKPAHLETLLLERRFRHVYDARGMVADLSKAPLDAPVPAGTTIRRVTSAREFDAYIEIFMEAFARYAHERELWRGAFEHFGFEESSPWTHYVGFAGDDPVSTTSLLAAGDLAGIYNVATVPRARGRGIGRAVTLAAMRRGRELGASRAVLQSSEMGYGVYLAIGFEDICPLRLYDWRPEYER
jgi:GNAT superfamily N-acetyltransferase